MDSADDRQINLWSNVRSKVHDSKSKEKSYSELSKEFRELYPTVVYAFQLVPKMYNTLTLVDRFSHKAALKKIMDDHKDLPGFSKRNIGRYLPSDNPGIPRRIRPRRPNSSQTISMQGTNLSDTKSSYSTRQFVEDNVDSVSGDKQCPRCRELEEALRADSRLKPADALLGSEEVCCVPKDKEYVLVDALNKSEQICYIFFVDGKFVHAEADIHKTSHSAPSGV